MPEAPFVLATSCAAAALLIMAALVGPAPELQLGDEHGLGAEEEWQRALLVGDDTDENTPNSTLIGESN